MFKKINLQLFAKNEKDPPIEEPPKEEPPKKDAPKKDDDIAGMFKEILNLIKPAEPKKEDVLQVPTPKTPKPNKEDEEEFKEKMEGGKTETWGKKMWKAIWR